MTAERGTPSPEQSEANEDSRYSLRVLLEIDSQQAAISTHAAGPAPRLEAGSRRLKAIRRDHRNAGPAANAASNADSFPAPRDSEPRASEKGLHRREQMLRRKLELQKWHTKYSVMLIEASPEFRLGALLKRVSGDAGSAGAARILARLGALNSDEASAIRSDIERILSDGEILKALLPLLDPLPNI